GGGVLCGSGGVCAVVAWGRRVLAAASAVRGALRTLGVAGVVRPFAPGGVARHTGTACPSALGAGPGAGGFARHTGTSAPAGGRGPAGIDAGARGTAAGPTGTRCAAVPPAITWRSSGGSARPVASRAPITRRSDA